MSKIAIEVGSKSNSGTVSKPREGVSVGTKEVTAPDVNATKPVTKPVTNDIQDEQPLEGSDMDGEVNDTDLPGVEGELGEGVDGSEGDLGEGMDGVEGDLGEDMNEIEGNSGEGVDGIEGDSGEGMDGIGIDSGMPDMGIDIGGDFIGGGEIGIGDGEWGIETGTQAEVKDPILSSWPFVISISSVVLVMSVVLGALLARIKIKKGIDLYED